MAKNTFLLTRREAAILNQEVVGNGGFQNFIRRLQRCLKPGCFLEISDADLGRAVRMMRYGSGGFEGRIHAALSRPISDAMVGC